jgi:chromate transporter
MTKISVWRVFLVFLKLGLSSFGGPVAHLGFFRDEFVVRRHCLREDTYADLVALCQFLPGPASSQVGIGIGLSLAGVRGGLAAWAGFTLPSALLLILFAYGVTALQPSVVADGWLHGLKVVAVAVVAQAIWGMAKSLCPDRPRGSVAILAAILSLTWPGMPGQISSIAGGAMLGLCCLRCEEIASHELHVSLPGKKVALICLFFFFTLLLVPPLLGATRFQELALFDSFYRSGALVFGGGHVVLPLLQSEVVTPGWISKDMFLAGYGAAQAVPGPLFTFAAYLGTVILIASAGWFGGLLCLSVIFLPSFLLVIGILPYWQRLRQNTHIRRALVGVNAAVVGLLLAAFYDPVWSSGILSTADFVLAIAAFGLLTLWKLPPWMVVGATAVGGAVIAFLV